MRKKEPKIIRKRNNQIRNDKVRKALKRMKRGKAVGPDDIPVEVWKCNRILETDNCSGTNLQEE